MTYDFANPDEEKLNQLKNYNFSIVINNVGYLCKNGDNIKRVIA